MVLMMRGGGRDLISIGSVKKLHLTTPYSDTSQMPPSSSVSFSFSSSPSSLLPPPPPPPLLSYYLLADASAPPALMHHRLCCGVCGNSPTPPPSAADPRGNKGKSINLIKCNQVLDFLPKWNWMLLNWLKILF